MTIHYHGLPLTPEIMLLDLSGRHVCISYATARARQVEQCLRLMQSIMFDNGAFTVRQQGGKLDIDAYYAWLAPMLRHPHWAVVPDVIDGTVEDQRNLAATWPFPKAYGAPVWHLHLPISFLIELAQAWPRVCLGSSGQFWTIGSKAWRRRMDEAAQALAASGCVAHIHGLRMMAEAENPLLNSVDSVNIARNYKDRDEMPSRMADRLDRINARIPQANHTEEDLFDVV